MPQVAGNRSTCACARGMYVKRITDGHAERPSWEKRAASFDARSHAEYGHCSSLIGFRHVSDVVQLW